MPSEQDYVDRLREVKESFVVQGEKLPAVMLPDGTKVQTGTVGALLPNIKLYDRIIAGEVIEGELSVLTCSQRLFWSDVGTSKAKLEEALTIPIPTLRKIGLFDIFPVDDWMTGSSEGRRFVGLRAKNMGYWCDEWTDCGRCVNAQGMVDLHSVMVEVRARCRRNKISVYAAAE
jgi:hypothetical protein